MRKVGMVISTEYEIGDKVTLRTDTEENIFIVIGFKVFKSHTTYIIAGGVGIELECYDIEIEKY